MIRYEVRLRCDPGLEPELEAWMRQDHIPALLATGCFASAHFDRGEGGFRTVYCARTIANLADYLAHHTARLRAEFQARFPSGIRAEREEWREVEAWTVTDDPAAR